MQYTVAIKRSEEGVAVWVPGLPGCVSQGLTEEEAIENVKDAIQTYLQVVTENTVGLETRTVEIPAA